MTRAGRALVLVVALAPAGCVPSTFLKDSLEALSKDTATLCAEIAYGPGVLKIKRTNIANGEVRCDNDGLTVRSGTPPAQ